MTLCARQRHWYTQLALLSQYTSGKPNPPYDTQQRVAENLKNSQVYVEADGGMHASRGSNESAFHNIGW